MRPTFLIIGAMKAGTTSTWALLDQHPQVFMSTAKEPHFFSKDEHYARGWAWYEQFYAGGENAIARGEASGSYTKRHLFPNAAPRIATDLPDAKLLYIVRDPLERFLSHWMHGPSRGAGVRSYATIDQAVTDEQMLRTSMYWYQISAYRDHFPDEQIKVVFFEDFRRDPVGTFRDYAAFLGIDPDFKPDRAGEARNKGDLTTDTRSLSWLRRLPGFGSLNRAAPQWLRSPFKKFMLKKHDQRPQWTDSARQRALDLIQDDITRFLHWTNKPRDFWPLAARSVAMPDHVVKW